MNPYADKVAIVTGAGSGIGRALGEALARHGAIVVWTDRQPERLRIAVAAPADTGGRRVARPLDVTEAPAFQSLVDDTVAHFGRLDYLFNNAGIAVGGEARDLTLEDWRAVLDVNLNGVIHGVAAAYPVMARQRSGHIVNMSSIEGLAPFPHTIGYVASKHAVVGLSNALRVEGADLGVKVSVVCPGYIRTAIFRESPLVHLDRAKLLGSLAGLKGMPPQECARRILNGVARNQAIIVVTRSAKALWALQRLSPGLVRLMMQRLAGRIRRQMRCDTRVENSLQTPQG